MRICLYSCSRFCLQSLRNHAKFPPKFELIAILDLGVNRNAYATSYHRRNGSSSPVLWQHIIPMGVRDFWLSISALAVRPTTSLHAKWLKGRAFTQECAFRSENRYFHTPWSPGRKGQNLRKIWTENFRLILPLTIKGPERQHSLFFIFWHSE